MTALGGGHTEQEGAKLAAKYIIQIKKSFSALNKF